MQAALNGSISKAHLNNPVQLGCFDHPEDTWTPLMRAASKTSGEMLSRLLVAHGIEVDGGNLCGKTALMVAAHQGNKFHCQALVEHGAVVTTRDSHGRDSLMYAAGGLRDGEATPHTLTHLHPTLTAYSIRLSLPRSERPTPLCVEVLTQRWGRRMSFLFCSTAKPISMASIARATPR